MSPRSLRIFAVMAFAAGAWIVPQGAAVSQSAQTTAHPLPQSLIFEHAETLERLTILSKRPGDVGVKARQAIEVMKRHAVREQEFILPPLTLLPSLADGKVTPDMAWAITMADRVRAEREEIFQERSRVTEALNALAAAAGHAHDKEAAEFAEAAQADTFNDAELLEPAVLLIGEYLHDKLQGAH